MGSLHGVKSRYPGFGGHPFFWGPPIPNVPILGVLLLPHLLGLGCPDAHRPHFWGIPWTPNIQILACCSSILGAVRFSEFPPFLRSHIWKLPHFWGVPSHSGGQLPDPLISQGYRILGVPWFWGPRFLGLARSWGSVVVHAQQAGCDGGHVALPERLVPAKQGTPKL